MPPRAKLHVVPLPRATSSLVPHSDVTVHIVLDDFGKAGRRLSRDRRGRHHLGSVVDDLLTGQFNNPVRVVAFNTSEGWSRDVSEDVAREVVRRLAERGRLACYQLAPVRRSLCRRGRAVACRKRCRVEHGFVAA